MSDKYMRSDIIELSKIFDMAAASIELRSLITSEQCAAVAALLKKLYGDSNIHYSAIISEYNNGSSMRVIAKKLDIPLATVAYTLKTSRIDKRKSNRGKDWSSTDDATLLRLKSAGLSARAIGLKMKRTERAINGRISKLKNSTN